MPDAWADPDRVFLAATAEGPADWVLVARLPGGELVEIPFAPSRSGSWRTCRPIGIYEAGTVATRRYEQEDR